MSVYESLTKCVGEVTRCTEGEGPLHDGEHEPQAEISFGAQDGAASVQQISP